jgi:hypothetical protein
LDDPGSLISPFSSWKRLLLFSLPKERFSHARPAEKLHRERTHLLRAHNMPLRELYRLLEDPGNNPIKDLQANLDKAVLAAYRFEAGGDELAQLLQLNLELAANEQRGDTIQGPGLPDFIPNKTPYITSDCEQFEP